jgi:hypothetical protein
MGLSTKGTRHTKPFIPNGEAVIRIDDVELTRTKRTGEPQAKFYFTHIPTKLKFKMWVMYRDTWYAIEVLLQIMDALGVVGNEDHPDGLDHMDQLSLRRHLKGGVLKADLIVKDDGGFAKVEFYKAKAVTPQELQNLKAQGLTTPVAHGGKANGGGGGNSGGYGGGGQQRTQQPQQSSGGYGGGGGYGGAPQGGYGGPPPQQQTQPQQVQEPPQQSGGQGGAYDDGFDAENIPF